MRYADNGEPVREGILTVGDTKFDLSENPAPKKELFRPDASWNTKSITCTPAGCSISLVPEHDAVCQRKERYRCGEEVTLKLPNRPDYIYSAVWDGFYASSSSDDAFTYLTFRMPNWDVKLTIEDHFVGEQY